MVFLDGRLLYVDILQPTKRYRQLYPELLRGSALEALVSAKRWDEPEATTLDKLRRQSDTVLTQHQLRRFGGPVEGLPNRGGL